MISPARFREIKQIIEDCTPGEPISLDKTTAMSLLKAAGVGMMAHLELQGKIAHQEALLRRHPDWARTMERSAEMAQKSLEEIRKAARRLDAFAK